VVLEKFSKKQTSLPYSGWYVGSLAADDAERHSVVEVATRKCQRRRENVSNLAV